jgi:drug/metabolite transporter (DMT)-like permease
MWRARTDQVQAVVFTALALVAFAANSVLCRLALWQGAIDAASFTTIRFTSGAAILFAISALTVSDSAASAPSDSISSAREAWISAAVLSLYAVAFAFAYVRLSTGTGALIMFGCVQVTMLLGARRAGERIRGVQAWGLGIALLGLIYLVSPGLSAPSPIGAVLMATAGTAWGLYSLRGRGTRDPLRQNASNFVRSVPFVVLVSLVSLSQWHIGRSGVTLAMGAGVIATGLGYVAWFAALRRLTAVRAAVVQLAVPVIAAAGGALLLSEPIRLRLVVASIMVLGGIALVIAARSAVVR